MIFVEGLKDLPIDDTGWYFSSTGCRMSITRDLICYIIIKDDQLTGLGLNSILGQTILRNIELTIGEIHYDLGLQWRKGSMVW